MPLSNQHLNQLPTKQITINQNQSTPLNSHLASKSMNPASVQPPSVAPMSNIPQTPIGLGIEPPQLQNIVSTVNLQCKLDLKKIAMHARNAEYNPKRFAAVIMRIREPRTTSLIFSSGKMVCTGAKSQEQSRMAARKFARIIQKLGFEVKFHEFKIRKGGLKVVILETFFEF